MTYVPAPSIFPAAGVMVMLLVPASPLPSLMMKVALVLGDAGRLTAVAAPEDFLTIMI
jgi:hypothetical protein